MSSFASRIRRPFQIAPRFAIAGVTAILLGLPSAAGATFLHPAGTASGKASSPRDVSLTFHDFHAEFVDRAALELDCDAPQLPSLAESFGPGRFHGVLGGGGIGDRGTPPWLDGGLGGNHHLISAELHLRHFCPVRPPPAIPEPETAVLLAGGLVALSLWRRRRPS